MIAVLKNFYRLAFSSYNRLSRDPWRWNCGDKAWIPAAWTRGRWKSK